MNYNKKYNEAEMMYTNGNYEKALDIFLILDKTQDDNDCQNYIGCCYLELKRYDDAKACFTRLIANNPKWERPYFNLGRVLFKQGKDEEAFKYYSIARRINPYNEDVYFYIGNYYLNQKRYKIAERNYQKSIDLNFEQSETHLNLGICYMERKIYDKALLEFDIAYHIDNECLSSIMNQGYIYIMLKDFEKALEKYLLLNNHMPDETATLKQIVICNYKIGNYKEAAVWNSRIAKLEPLNEFAAKMNEKLKAVNISDD